MKFGKLADISGVNFSLPEDTPLTKNLLNQISKKQSLPTVYVGCTGWSMKEWLGKVYPPKTPVKEYLWYYTRQFNTIELNTTHYRIPDAKTIEKWKTASAADFQFCPKVPQTISHSSTLAIDNQLINAFCSAVGDLEEKLGCCFLQLPPYFGLDRLPVLEHFLGRWPSEIPLAVEFRHESWFEGAGQKGFELLASKGITSVITDVAGRRDVLHQNLTSDKTMIRFVGNDLDPSDYRRIDEWVVRLKYWLEKGLSEIYFFTHEPDNILAPDLSLYLTEAIKRDCPAITRGPKLREEGPKQMSLF